MTKAQRIHKTISEPTPEAALPMIAPRHVVVHTKLRFYLKPLALHRFPQPILIRRDVDNTLRQGYSRPGPAKM
jgi:hypothetical protein